MSRVLRVGIQRGAIRERDAESRIVRASGIADHIFANLQVDDAVQSRERTQAFAVLCARVPIGARSVLEADEVHQHQSSSPSMSVSAISTTRLWTSTRNHLRNVSRSR